MNLRAWSLALVFWAFAAWASAQTVALGTNCLVRFATVDAARGVLTNRDEFIRAMSPADRAIRVGTNPASEQDYIDALRRSPAEWSSAETNRVGVVIGRIGSRFARWNIPVPSEILLIKTVGPEEGNSCYTRQNAVILSEETLGVSDSQLYSVLTHELFHVISRANPDLRRRLYAIIGFEPVGEVPYPESLQGMKASNPDGVQNGWAITLTNDTISFRAVPVLFFNEAALEPRERLEFSPQLMQFRLMEVRQEKDGWKPVLSGGKPNLIVPETTPGFWKQVGRNTDYIIHPDEILAENFVFMIFNLQSARTPRIQTEMRRVFQKPALPESVDGVPKS
jgi:hypothetical protein